MFNNDRSGDSRTEAGLRWIEIRPGELIGPSERGQPPEDRDARFRRNTAGNVGHCLL